MEKELLLSKEQIAELNKKYNKLTIEQRIEELYKDFDESEVMLTSSFAATSALLLKLFSDVRPTQRVHFINTGYHFPETIIYKDYLSKLYNLDVIEVGASPEDFEETQMQLLWTSDPDKCCKINKVDPLESIKDDYSVWVSGLMKWQSDHRATLDIFEERKGILKFYPLLDVSAEQREEYISSHHLPFHPLVSKGYFSIGCANCTVPGDGRDGRWNNNPKTECGLHL